MLIVDASVLAPAIADGGPDGVRYRKRLRGESIGGPELVRIEVLSVLRRQVLHGSLTPTQAGVAVSDLGTLPISIFPIEALLERCWQLRDNVTPYDACYVALAEALDCVLLTADGRLAKASGPRCTLEVL